LQQASPPSPRPPRGNYTCRLDLRLEPGQKERWQQCAGGNVSGWLKNLAEREVLKHHPPQADLSKSEAHARRQVYKARGCPRWMYHVIGVYCPGCDTLIPG